MLVYSHLCIIAVCREPDTEDHMYPDNSRPSAKTVEGTEQDQDNARKGEGFAPEGRGACSLSLFSQKKKRESERLRRRLRLRLRLR